jgi:hypoxia up-regulated 1
MGMQFACVRSVAEDVAKERVSDVALTVPPYFSNAEWEALLDAIEIGELLPLAFVLTMGPQSLSIMR